MSWINFCLIIKKKKKAFRKNVVYDIINFYFFIFFHFLSPLHFSTLSLPPPSLPLLPLSPLSLLTLRSPAPVQSSSRRSASRIRQVLRSRRRSHRRFNLLRAGSRSAPRIRQVRSPAAVAGDSFSFAPNPDPPLLSGRFFDLPISRPQSPEICSPSRKIQIHPRAGSRSSPRAFASATTSSPARPTSSPISSRSPDRPRLGPNFLVI